MLLAREDCQSGIQLHTVIKDAERPALRKRSHSLNLNKPQETELNNKKLIESLNIVC